MKVEDIDIRLISVTENVRLGKSDSEMKQLMESIKQHGLKEPIGVSKEKKGERYTLLYGFRRLEAYKKLGYKTIPAVIVGPVEHSEHLIVNSLENLQRRDVTPFELGRICQKLVKLGLTPGEIAASLSQPIGRIKGAMTITSKIPLKLRSKVAFIKPGHAKNGQISATTTYDILQIARNTNLTSKEVSMLMEESRTRELSNVDIYNIANLLKKGLSIKDALVKVAEYQTIRMAVTIKRSEAEAVMKKHDINKGELISMIVYGILPPLTKPSFITYKEVKEKANTETR